MRNILLVTLIFIITSVSSCDIIGEDEVDESTIPSINHPNSVFKATINGVEWNSEISLVTRAVTQNLSISGGQGTDTIMFFIWEFWL